MPPQKSGISRPIKGRLMLISMPGIALAVSGPFKGQLMVAFTHVLVDNKPLHVLVAIAKVLMVSLADRFNFVSKFLVCIWLEVAWLLNS
ncbi:hypothetical protein IEQ34_011618 [Dendrobium chrysotoxum]|uniref:Uncharacterized protein n=1 Tax=Dendrobium chrysotoxum TaxID=161865 RepID=A0AAV7GAH6_DENCH|nr:hypothetical protein IEQ34_011618 [Dendrobium chrysotoxum]